MLQLNEQVFLLVLHSIDLVVDLHLFPFDHVESSLVFSKIELLNETLAIIDRSIDREDHLRSAEQSLSAACVRPEGPHRN